MCCYFSHKVTCSSDFIPNFWHCIRGERVTQKSVPHLACPPFPKWPAGLNSPSVNKRIRLWYTRPGKLNICSYFRQGIGWRICKCSSRNETLQLVWMAPSTTRPWRYVSQRIACPLEKLFPLLNVKLKTNKQINSPCSWAIRFSITCFTVLFNFSVII